MLIRLEFRNKFIAAGDSPDSLAGDRETRTHGKQMEAKPWVYIYALLVTSQNILCRF